MARWIDPPSGWRYGFPKAIPQDCADYKGWLLSNGYPQEEIDSCGESFYVRTWETDDNTE